jgi:AcrR family transcriptional regulator
MPRARRATEVRQIELADAALRLIATRGVASLSTRSLAEAVGLSSGAIFRHFASLEALLEAVVGRVEAVLSVTYPPRTLPPRQRLARFVEARSVTVGDRIGILRLVLSEQFLLALPPSASERLTAQVQRTRAFVTECLRDGQAAGELRDDLAPEALAPIVMGTIQLLAFAGAGPLRRSVDAQAVREALDTLLAPRPAARAPARRRR